MATQWIGSLSPPKGVEPNFVNPENQLDSNIALHTVCLTLATAAVTMRLYTRGFIIRVPLGVDDYCCLISYCLSIVFSILMIKSYTWGIGRHMWDEPLQWLVTALKYFSIAEYFYIPMTGTIKLTFLFLYYRIFPSQTMTRHFITGGIIFVVVSNLTLLFLTIFSCKPVSHAWNELGEGKCWDPIILPYLSGALSVSTDLYVLVLPMRSLSGLNMSAHRKLKIMTVFGLGIFACIASIVRLGETHILTTSPDATWNLSRIGIWATIEGDVGIFVSCLNLLPAFLDRHFSKSFFSSFSRLFSTRTSEKREKESDLLSGAAQAWPSNKPWESSDDQAYIEMGSREV